MSASRRDSPSLAAGPISDSRSHTFAFTGWPVSPKCLMGINIGTVDDRSHEANFSSQCRGRDDLRESFGFAVSITPACFEASRAVPKGVPPPTVAANIPGKYALRSLFLIASHVILAQWVLATSAASCPQAMAMAVIAFAT